MEDRSWEKTCIVGIRLKTWERTSVHGLISGWVEPWERPLGHADVNWVKALPGLDGRREIRMHNLLLEFLEWTKWRLCPLRLQKEEVGSVRVSTAD